MGIDRNLEQLKSLNNSIKNSDRNEDTTRLQIIDRLIFDCLDWEYNDCVTEESHNSTYTDYTLSLNGRRSVIWEAKKEGIHFEISQSSQNRTYLLKTLCTGNTELKQAIEQVTSYCQERGVPIGVVCNGHQICAFFGVRSDGIAPMAGKAIVFHSLDDIEANFVEFWDVLSREGLRTHALYRKLVSGISLQLPPRPATLLSDYPGMRSRNTFQANLQHLSELVLESIPKRPELETQFLESCYCSSGALSQYSITSQTILKSRYDNMFEGLEHVPAHMPASSKQHSITPELVAQSLVSRPILLIGDVGVGKTMFIRNLIKIQAANQIKEGVSIYINLGSQANLTDSLKHYILEDIESQLLNEYNIDIHERNFVRGVYNIEMDRFRKGIYGDLYDKDIDRYRDYEREKLRELSTNSQHLKHCIEHIVNARKKQVIIFIDNADQRDTEIQQQAFLISEELAQQWGASVFVSLRPETYHHSQQSGALSGYHTLAFTIAPPRVDLVVEKRIDFALRQLERGIPLPNNGTISGSFPSLTSMLKVLKFSVKNNSDLHQAIDNLSAGNVRKALDFIRIFLGSGHVDTAKIVNFYEKSGSYRIPTHEFLRALIYGDYKYFSSQRSEFFNVFDIREDSASWHFATLQLLNSLVNAGQNQDGFGFVQRDIIIQEMQSIGYSPHSSETLIRSLVSNGLLDTGIKGDNRQNPLKVRTTSLGLYHLHILPKMFTYVDAMIVDTPIRTSSMRSSLRGDVFPIQDRLERARKFVSYLSQQWEEADMPKTIFNWLDYESELLSNIDDIESRLKHD